MFNNIIFRENKYLTIINQPTSVSISVSLFCIKYKYNADIKDLQSVLLR